MKDSRFFEAALPMIRTIPDVASEKCFALKGGTAINLFVRDLPRLSIDIDLTYVPVEPREESLQSISEALGRMAARISKSNPKIEILKSTLKGTPHVFKLTIRDGTSQVKIEPNTF